MSKKTTFEKFFKFFFDKVRKIFFLFIVYLLIKAEEIFLNEFIESCFFRLMTMVGERGRGGMRCS